MTIVAASIFSARTIRKDRARLISESLQGTKAYGVHVRPIAIPAREDRDEMREEPNFYWLQEEFLKARQRNSDWHWTILRPQIIFGESFGSAMNLIPALGTYAAMLREDGLP
jgi:hypothetical protein